MDCLFCKIANKEIPAIIIYEDELVVAFEDIQPQAPYHFLIIPKVHIASLHHISLQTAHIAGHLLLTAQELAKTMGFAEQGYRSVINCHEWGGQTVAHLHLHVLAGRQLTWPPG